MALITDPDNLNQGDENVVGDLAFTPPPPPSPR